jgi:hypothetical protein
VQVINDIDSDFDDVLQAIKKQIQKTKMDEDFVWNQLFIYVFNQIRKELKEKDEWIATPERCLRFVKVSKMYSFLAYMCASLAKENRPKTSEILPLDIRSNMLNKRYHSASEKLLDLLAIANIRSDIVLNTAIDCFNMLAMNYIHRNASEYLSTNHRSAIKRFVKDSVCVESPARLGIMSGGEADYFGINELEGSHAINAAIDVDLNGGLDGRRPAAPLMVEIVRTPYDNEISFWFNDVRKSKPEYATCRTRREIFSQFRDGSEICDTFNLFKTMLVTMGIVTNSEHRRLPDVLESLGGGLSVTVTARMPMQCGLAQISGLALAYIEALSEMTGMRLPDDEKYKLCAYALNSIKMTTAWQDVFTIGKGGGLQVAMVPGQELPAAFNPNFPAFDEIISKITVLIYFLR